MKKTMLLSLLLLPFLFLSPQPVAAEAAYTPYQIPNGGFENGDLSGWQVFRLWKNEDGLAAFDSSLVHGKNYFSHNNGSGYPYGRDGSYQLGITSEADQETGTIKWDQASERMGYLRSSNFILGGSGWISFKLGGGRYESFAYVSVRKVSDDTEIARFANTNYNDTAIATTQYGSSITNAEAFLFQYYYDLDLVADIGDSLYVVLCDTSAYDWSILSADSFVTYYASDPTPGANQTATNILPTISGVDTASNAIVNGTFDTDFSGWTTSNDYHLGWGRKDNAAKSNNANGDGGMGILRSSAFTVSTNKYVKLNWAGGLKHDKQIFISIKEVGTNIEKLRYVRRSNLDSTESESYHNHLLNLTSLSDSQKYYLELADARSGGWGISYVDSITITTQSEWDSTDSGYRAVSISNLPLSFDVNYAQEAASYASYFLEQTAPYCEVLDGANVDWSNLSDEYATLSDDAKDYFVSGGTDSEILAARERYLYLINKYGTLAADSFVVDSLGEPYDGSYDPILPPVTEGNQTKLALALMITLSTALLAGTAFIYLRKKNRVY